MVTHIVFARSFFEIVGAARCHSRRLTRAPASKLLQRPEAIFACSSFILHRTGKTGLPVRFHLDTRTWCGRAKGRHARKLESGRSHPSLWIFRMKSKLVSSIASEDGSRVRQLRKASDVEFAFRASDAMTRWLEESLKGKFMSRYHINRYA